MQVNPAICRDRHRWCLAATYLAAGTFHSRPFCRQGKHLTLPFTLQPPNTNATPYAKNLNPLPQFPTVKTLTPYPNLTATTP
ncbi:hypothetical protein FKM82_028893 [Ascaphus truei]